MQCIRRWRGNLWGGSFPRGLQSTVISGRHVLDKANEDLNAEYADGYEPSCLFNPENDIMQQMPFYLRSLLFLAATFSTWTCCCDNTFLDWDFHNTITVSGLLLCRCIPIIRNHLRFLIVRLICIQWMGREKKDYGNVNIYHYELCFDPGNLYVQEIHTKARSLGRLSANPRSDWVLAGSRVTPSWQVGHLFCYSYSLWIRIKQYSFCRLNI